MCGGDNDARLFSHSTHCCILLQSALSCIYQPKAPLVTESYLFSYTECPRRNVPDFGRAFLTLKYTDITQNTYIQSLKFTEIMAREKCGLLAVPRTAPVQLTRYVYTKMRS